MAARQFAAVVVVVWILDSTRTATTATATSTAATATNEFNLIVLLGPRRRLRLLLCLAF